MKIESNQYLRHNITEITPKGKIKGIKYIVYHLEHDIIVSQLIFSSVQIFVVFFSRTQKLKSYHKIWKLNHYPRNTNHFCVKQQ